MNVKALKEIGLTETEIKVYLALLNLGTTSAGKIFHETGVYRKNLYDALSKLIDKGLVTYVKENKIKFFQTKNPDNLFNYLDEQKSKIEEKKNLVSESKNKPITKSKYYKYKILPKILSGLNVIYIYGDSIANVLWLEKPLAFVTKHKELAKNYRKYFNYLWENI